MFDAQIVFVVNWNETTKNNKKNKSSTLLLDDFV